MQPPPIQISAHTSKCWPRLVSIMIILFHKVKFIACGIIAEKCICAVFGSTKNYQRRGRYTTLLRVLYKKKANIYQATTGNLKWPATETCLM